MSTTERDEATVRALRAAMMLVGDDELQQELRDEDRAAVALKELGLPDSARARLLDLVNTLDRVGSRDAGVELTPSEDGQDEIARTLLESYTHIRWSFWTLFAMSVMLFLVGLALLGTAVARSLNEDSVTSSTLTIGGLGIADIVVLFYARPWKDIARNLSTSQQTRIIATSYLASVALLHQGQTDKFALLQELTERSVAMLRAGEAKPSEEGAVRVQPTTTGMKRSRLASGPRERFEWALELRAVDPTED